MRRPGTQKTLGTQFGASLKIPFPCSSALAAIELADINPP